VGSCGKPARLIRRMALDDTPAYGKTTLQYNTLCLE
jgi:hypothetical protein